MNIYKLICTLIAFLFMTACPSAMAADYVVTANTLNIRSQPSTSAKVVGSLTKGDIISDVDHLSDGWMRIQQNGEVKGYISTQYLEKVGPTESETVEREEQRQWQYLYMIDQAKAKLRWIFGIFGIVFLISVILMRFDVIHPFFIPFLLSLTMIGLPAALIWYLHTTPYSLWFIYPSVIGWGWTIGNIFMFLIVLFIGGKVCIDGVKALFDWSDPLFTLIEIGAGAAFGYAIYLAVGALLHQTPEALILLGGLLGGGGSSINSSGTLRDRYGHDVDGHFGSNGDFYGKDGNTYKKNWGDGTWDRE